MFTIVKQLLGGNKDITNEQRLSDNSDSMITDSKKIRMTWKDHHDCLSNKELYWDRNSLKETSTVQGPFPKVACDLIKDIKQLK